jgi:hypothetical protein
MGRAHHSFKDAVTGVAGRADAFATTFGCGRGLSASQRRERARVSALRAIPRALTQLLELGFVEAETLPSGEAGYTVSARGQRYCEIAAADDAVAALLSRMMRVAVNS